MKKFLLPLAAFALLTATAAHAEDGEKKPRPRPDHFAEADANKDGFITREEMQSVQKKRMDKMFEHTDANKDGKLSKDEMEKGREEMRKRFKKDHGSAPGGAPPPHDD